MTDGGDEAREVADIQCARRRVSIGNEIGRPTAGATVLVRVCAYGQFIGISPAIAITIACNNAGAGTRVAGDGEARECDDDAEQDTGDRKGVEEGPEIAVGG